MQLTGRDTEIIEWLTINKGATINQINKMFFTNYTTCSIRLKKLADNKFLKVEKHPVLNKKVYYIKRLPSYHALILTDFIIENKGNIEFMQREYKLKNNKVDCIIILKTGKIIIVEIDIYNTTKDKKIEEIWKALEKVEGEKEVWIISKRERQKKNNKVIYRVI